MSKESYNQIIDEVYERYWSSIEISEYDGIGPTSIKLPKLSKEEFINKCKTDTEFSETWGLKIEERELKHKERIKLAWTIFFPDRKNESVPDWWNVKLLTMDDNNIPTKLITITYNNETVESYE